MVVLRSEDHVAPWLAQRSIEAGASFGLEQCWGLAEGWYADKLAEDWRRPTREQAAALLGSLGLEGPFWRLPLR